MVSNNDSLASKTGINGWKLVQAVSGSLVVAGILGLSGLVIGLRDTVREHDVLMGQFEIFHKTGERYTKRDGNIDRTSSLAADATIIARINTLFRQQEQARIECRAHSERSEHTGADLRLGHIERDVITIRDDLRAHVRPQDHEK